ncbi:MAG: hypothetical protein WC650_04410 [Candidatus Doudnabacteria bacterium]
MPETITQIINSPVLNVVLTLLIFFQWYKQRAKEQSIKNNLFSIRRMIDRTSGVNSLQAIAQKSADLIDTIDSTLATLGARTPFKKRLLEMLDIIEMRFRKESSKDLERLPNETDIEEKKIKRIKNKKSKK